MDLTEIAQQTADGTEAGGVPEPVDIAKVHKDLVADITSDLSDRQDWETEQQRWRRERLNEDQRKRLPYPNAPDLREPLIDDQIDAVKAQQMATLFGSRTLATFIPLDPAALQHHRKAEEAFDNILRFSSTFRAQIEQAFDYCAERGFALLKLCVEDREDGGSYPSVEAWDPLDVVVPTATKRLADADRVCFILRYTEREFRAVGTKARWQNVEEVLAKVKDGNHGKSGSSSDKGVMRSSMGTKTLPSNQQQVEVWEIYHWMSPTAGANPRKYRLITCPDAPDLAISHQAWEWPAVSQDVQTADPMSGMPMMQTVDVTPAMPRRWPVAYLPFENRGGGRYYDTRGIAKKISDMQKEATAYRNGKAVVMYYACKPFVSGPRGIMASFKWQPGEQLPADAKLVPPMGVDPIFDYSTDMTRQAAARRVGAPFGALSSTSNKRDTKTATEVSVTADLFTMQSSVSVERFGDSLAELFAIMWDHLVHNPDGIRTVSEAGYAEVPREILQAKYQIRCGVTGKMANPDLMFRFLTALQQPLALFPQVAQFVKGAEMANFLFDLVDPKLTDRLIVKTDEAGPAGQAPIEQQVMQLAQVVAQMRQYLTSLAQSDAGADAGGDGASPAAPSQPRQPSPMPGPSAMPPEGMGSMGSGGRMMAVGGMANG